LQLGTSAEYICKVYLFIIVNCSITATCVLYQFDVQTEHLHGHDCRNSGHKIVSLETWVSAKIFPGVATLTFCLPGSGCYRCNANRRSQNGLSCLHHKETPHITATVTKIRFVGRNGQVYYDNLHNRLYRDFKIRVILFKETLPLVFEESSVPWSDFILCSKRAFEDLWLLYSWFTIKKNKCYNRQRRIFIFGAPGYFKLGALL